MIYFDNAATTGHKPKSVVDTVNFCLNNLSANPGRSGHNLSQNAGMVLYNARKKTADYFGASGPEKVVFTLNCTQSINFVLKGILKKGDHIVVSNLEHNAVMRPIYEMGIDYTMADVSLLRDNVTVENFKNAIKPNTKMIFCTYASNVIGKILPIKAIGKICREKGILFSVDAAQGAGVLPINIAEMNIDFLCIAPHKGLYCPMGVGVLIAEKDIEKTIIEGGTGTDSLSFKQPFTLPEMLESGTVNLPAIASISAGIDFVKKRGENIYKYESALVKRFYNGLKDDRVIFYTNPTYENYAPVLSFNISGYLSDYVAKYLNSHGFALRSGFHCAPTAHKKIDTLNTGTVRFSTSVFNSEQEVDALIKTIKSFLKNIKNTIE